MTKLTISKDARQTKLMQSLEAAYKRRVLTFCDDNPLPRLPNGKSLGIDFNDVFVSGMSMYFYVGKMPWIEK